MDHSRERDQKDLAKENSRLRRELALVKRQLAKSQKRERRLGVAEVDDDDAETPSPKDPPPTCRECGSEDLAVFETPSGKVVTFCKNCRFKEAR